MTLLALKNHISAQLSAVTEFAEREAYLIIESLTGFDKLAVITSDAEAERILLDRAEEIVARRLDREPLQYILGKAYFRDLELVVSRDVLVPRPETEIMVDWIISEARRMNAEKISRGEDGRVRVLDIGTGSGAISAAVACECGGIVSVVASDISRDALKIAGRNLEMYANVELAESDLFGGISGVFDIICSNPPYIGEHERPSLAPELEYEPEPALFAGDGLDVYRRLIPDIPKYIASGGSFILEIGAEQFDSVNEIVIRSTGRTDAEAVLDYADRRRFICLRNLK